MNVVSNTAMLFVACCTMSGCVAAWGDSKKVTRANEAGIAIQYDNAMFSSAGAKMIADKHCAEFGKIAEIEDVQIPGVLLGIIQETYSCV